MMRSPVLEQLPLTLQRNFTLMRDLDVQVAGEFILHMYLIPREPSRG